MSIVIYCRLLVVASVLLSTISEVRSLEHDWDCVSCSNNSMLVANFGTWRKDINLSDPWWVNTIADSHAAYILNNYWDMSYNGTGVDSKVKVARALKKRNPKMKVYFYQPADRVGDTVYIMNILKSHPEWWLRDDFGNLIPFGRCQPSDPNPEDFFATYEQGRTLTSLNIGDQSTQSCRPQVDPTVVAAQDFIANLSISLFPTREEAASHLDGVMVDGTSWTGASRYGPNISDARYQKLFMGKMETLSKMQKLLTELSGGEVWGNPLMEYGQISPNPGPKGNTAGANWNTSMAYYDGAFDEMFGAFGTMLATGDWDSHKMKFSFDTIANATAAGKTVVIHAFPGPAGTGSYGDMFPTRGPQGNQFHVAQWAGPTRVPNTTDGCRQASQDRLIESLAPFLIVATERVFFGYGWFYNLEDGYIPCPQDIECGMPNEWFPEYSKPIGAPLGAAVQSEGGMVWKREFEHVSVSVDLRNRELSSVTWH